jgi:hypothetical protein
MKPVAKPLPIGQMPATPGQSRKKFNSPSRSASSSSQRAPGRARCRSCDSVQRRQPSGLDGPPMNSQSAGEIDALALQQMMGGSSSGDADGPVGVSGHRHGHRSRSLMGTFGRAEIEVPRARLDGPDAKTTEWKSKTLRAYQRRTLAADALIASTYLAGTNTRRVHRSPRGAVRRCGRQGHGESGVAEGEGQLEGLERPLARRGADRAADPRRHRRSRPTRPQARRSGRSRPTSPCLPHRGRCAGAAKRQSPRSGTACRFRGDGAFARQTDIVVNSCLKRPPWVVQPV